MSSLLQLSIALLASIPPPPVQSFSVHGMDGHLKTYKTQGEKVTVVVFVSTRCPISNAFNFRLNTLYTQFSDRVQFAIVDSNVNESNEEISAHAKEMEYDFPVLQDVDNSLADLLGAKSTPDSFVIDRHGVVVYHGYIEDGLNPQRSKDPALRIAIQATLDGLSVAVPETHARGCAIRRTHAP
ncbi:MAG: redoxin domain-containing protein [Bryobacteraceae bacterium]